MCTLYVNTRICFNEYLAIIILNKIWQDWFTLTRLYKASEGKLRFFNDRKFIKSQCCQCGVIQYQPWVLLLISLQITLKTYEPRSVKNGLIDILEVYVENT